jgi:hypothetical protein
VKLDYTGLGVENAFATCFFSDMKYFTAIAEKETVHHQERKIFGVTSGAKELPRYGELNPVRFSRR